MTESSSESQPARRLDSHGLDSIAEVKLDEFKAATQDPAVKKFLAQAKEQGERLEQEGLIHP